MKTTIANSGVPVLILSFSSPLMTEPPTSNIFRVGPINDRMQGRGIANYLVSTEKLQKIAILRQSDEYGATGAASVTERLKELKMAPVATEVFNAADTDFTSQVLWVRAANPDAIIVYGYPAPSAIVTRQLREVGIKAEIIGSSATSNQNYPELVGKIGAGTKFVSALEHLPESDFPAMKKFREAFQKRFPDLARQGRPALGDVLGYGGAMTMVEAIRRKLEHSGMGRLAGSNAALDPSASRVTKRLVCGVNFLAEGPCGGLHPGFHDVVKLCAAN